MNKSKDKTAVKNGKQSSKDQKTIQTAKNQPFNPKKVAPPQLPKNQKPTSKKGDNVPIKDEKSDFLPGQKYKSPEQDSGAKAFYTSLYQQNTRSQMAQKYCLQYGLLDPSQAQRIVNSLSRSFRGKK